MFDDTLEGNISKLSSVDELADPTLFPRAVDVLRRGCFAAIRIPADLELTSLNFTAASSAETDSVVRRKPIEASARNTMKHRRGVSRSGGTFSCVYVRACVSRGVKSKGRKERNAAGRGKVSRKEGTRGRSFPETFVSVCRMGDRKDLWLTYCIYNGAWLSVSIDLMDMPERIDINVRASRDIYCSATDSVLDEGFLV